MWPFLQWVNPENATDEAAEFYQEAGQAPIMRCFSIRPDFGKEINAAARKFHFSDGALSRRDHELIATYVSGLNRCPFWVDSHAAFLRSQGETKEVTEAIFNGDLETAIQAGLDEKRSIMLGLVRKLTFESYNVVQEDIDVLRRAGYADEEIAEVVYDSAMFAFFNRVADGFGLPNTRRLEMFDA